MSDLLALADEIERAAEGSRELDVRIHESAVGLRMYESIHERGGDLCLRYYPGPPGPEYGRLPRYTTSLDAALSLVPDERGRPAAMHVQRTRNFNCCAVVWVDSEFGRSVRGDAKSPALALCAASLRAIHQGRSK